MNQPYQLVIDIWEGNPTLDVDALLLNGVVGMIVRLNDMSGGHHMDAKFQENWERAKRFPVQTIYFVYNPWVSGEANARWLVQHLPTDFGTRRIMIDIEVRYPDYSAATYACEVKTFLALINSTFQTAIYTGGWFIPTIATWPKDQSYWWAAYPVVLDGCPDWTQYKLRLAALRFETFTANAPGPVMLWQCSGDAVKKLEGFNGRAVDVNIFQGDLESLRNWMRVPLGGEETTPVDEDIATAQFRVIQDLVNIRTGPGVHFMDVGDLHRGDTITMHELGGSSVWIQIGPNRWIAFQYGNKRYLEIIKRLT